MVKFGCLMRFSPLIGGENDPLRFKPNPDNMATKVCFIFPLCIQAKKHIFHFTRP